MKFYLKPPYSLILFHVLSEHVLKQKFKSKNALFCCRKNCRALGSNQNILPPTVFPQTPMASSGWGPLDPDIKPPMTNFSLRTC